MYKYLAFNPKDDETIKFLSKIMLLGKSDAERVYISKDTAKNSKIKLSGLSIIQSKNVPIGQVWFLNEI